MSEFEYPYEAVRAFCSTKPTEFDAFMRQWHMEHPKPKIVQTDAIIPIAEMPKKKRTRKVVPLTESESESEPVEQE